MKNNRYPMETDVTAKKCIEQAKALRQNIKNEAGMSFQAYLPSSLADWILEKVENGVFIDPSEAVFYLLQEVKELEPHHDLRKQLLQRKLDEAQKGPFVDGEEFFHSLKVKLKNSPTLPVKWIKIDNNHT